MKLYHGTNIDFKDIDLTKSNKYKDFGQGFYLTDIRSQAEQLAIKKSRLFGGEPIVQVYEINETLLESDNLNILKFERPNTEWAEFIFNNRDENQKFTPSYDIVYGPIANDYIGLQIRDFKRNNITFEQFLNKIQYHKGITFQYAFCTKKAIEKLIRI